MKDFKNKVVVVTGAGSGMGRAYATEFGKLGAKLALNDYEEGPMKETLEILKNQGVTDVYSELFDVSDKDKMFGFADNVKARFGNAHVVINNAGIEGAVKVQHLLHRELVGRDVSAQIKITQSAATDAQAAVGAASAWGATLVDQVLAAIIPSAQAAEGGCIEDVCTSEAGATVMMIERHQPSVDAKILLEITTSSRVRLTSSPPLRTTP